MSRRTSLALTPADYAAATPGDSARCLIAVALARQYGGEWSVSAGSATQARTRRRMRLGRDARTTLARFDKGSTRARRRPVTVTLYDRGKRSRKASAAKGAAAGGVLLMGASGGLWWVPLLAMTAAAAAVAVYVVLVAGKVSAPRVARGGSAQPYGRPRWPHESVNRRRSTGVG